jgi:TM2 domain-containing membrane protein YozV
MSNLLLIDYPGERRRAVLCKLIITIAVVTCTWSAARAGEGDVYKMARYYYDGGNYYSAITELLRYQCLYPAGPDYHRSMILMGKAYYKGTNYPGALQVFYSCHRDFPETAEGDEGLYLAGFTMLMKGVPHEAQKFYDLYRVSYQKGKFMEELDRDACFAAAFAMDLPGSLNSIGKYRERYRQGKYGADVDALEKNVLAEMDGHRRHLWASVLGSIFIPGFGQFYTGNYGTGVLTFISNALCIFMIYNGYRLHDTYQMVFFSLAEAFLYQYNIFSAVRVVDDFNRKRNGDFFKKIRLGITAAF